MNCFKFSCRENMDEPYNPTKSISVTSCTKRSWTGLNSQTVSKVSTEPTRRANVPTFPQRPSNLKVFTYAELKAATNGFNRSSILGEGGFGCVYFGTIKSPQDPTKRVHVAIKQLGRRGLQGHKEWVTEVNLLGVVEHPNLVRLVGYCAEDDERGIQRLLVYEYMSNGSVEDHLSGRTGEPLSWTMRLKVAQDAARGLTYLHEQMDIQVVGTMGYAAPEYIQTGRLRSQSDVWSYGVFLYELITGRRPVDRNLPKNEQKLLEWVKPYLSSTKFSLIVDSRLEDKYSMESAQRLSIVANKCLSKNPKARPKMSEVLEMVNRLVRNGSEGTSPVLPLGSPVHVVPSVESFEAEKDFEESQ